MNVHDSFRDFVLDQLRDLGTVECRAMFGGHGLYCGGVFFGILYRGALYLKTDKMTRAEYERRGMKPFRPNERQTLKSYYEVPADILEDPEALVHWATQAIRSARNPRNR